MKFKQIQQITSQEKIQFAALKTAVIDRFRAGHAHTPSLAADWTGQDIVLFQEDLRSKTQGSISEKSFYTYFKNTAKKLPRIDVLNMLSTYVGHQNWVAFCASLTIDEEKKKKKKKKFNTSYLIIGICLVIGFVSGFMQATKKSTFSFCFMDNDRGQPILDISLDIIILNKKESPERLKTDSLGCFQWKTKDDYIKFVVQSPYHKTDTIYRSADEDFNPEIRLKTDDYNLMLHYYANGNVSDWQKRRSELQKLVAQDALILQILPYNLGVEIYTKEAFVNKLTTPTRSLKDFEIISSSKEGGKIVKLKFKTSL